ncbi:unnamed protein product [Protopolystoma xenopodis]|uniref:Quinolinate phosphoribosyltransferase [decarboxylating] n=1 Tax=Protopolystoma xenopodis TaxID=117903 RepID=A0A3S5CQG5_9PLAT|nr:unnamed protein product [Protopolystoma xenopodis]
MSYAKILSVLAGVPFVDELFQDLNCTVTWKKEEGSFIHNAPTPVAVVSGPADELIHGERLASIILLKKILGETSWKGDLLGPRKLTPGFSLVEEYALMVVGVASCKTVSSVILRQPHVLASGSAIESVRDKVDSSVRVQVQCNDIAEAKSASQAGADIILYENILPKLKASFSKVLVEINGPFDESNIRPFAISSVNYISSEKLSNGYAPIEFQVKYEKRPMEEGDKHSELLLSLSSFV